MKCQCKKMKSPKISPTLTDSGFSDSATPLLGSLFTLSNFSLSILS